jgi:hypothetical protein
MRWLYFLATFFFFFFSEWPMAHRRARNTTKRFFLNQDWLCKVFMRKTKQAVCRMASEGGSPALLVLSKVCESY